MRELFKTYKREYFEQSWCYWYSPIQKEVTNFKVSIKMPKSYKYETIKTNDRIDNKRRCGLIYFWKMNQSIILPSKYPKGLCINNRSTQTMTNVLQCTNT